MNNDRQRWVRRELRTYASLWQVETTLRKGQDMNERFDDLTQQLAEGASRRKALLGVAALGLGSLGLAAFGNDADAKNKCNRCKDKCRDNNQKKRKNKNKKNCSSKCRKKCRNK